MYNDMLPWWLSGKESTCQWEDALEKEMAAHSSILAWEIPWIEEPGRLQSMGSQRVRHDLATKQQLYKELVIVHQFTWSTPTFAYDLILSYLFYK